jgi:hypothetical protein
MHWNPPSPSYGLIISSSDITPIALSCSWPVVRMISVMDSVGSSLLHLRGSARICRWWGPMETITAQWTANSVISAVVSLWTPVRQVVRWRGLPVGSMEGREWCVGVVMATVATGWSVWLVHRVAGQRQEKSVMESINARWTANLAICAAVRFALDSGGNFLWAVWILCALIVSSGWGWGRLLCPWTECSIVKGETLSHA